MGEVYYEIKYNLTEEEISAFEKFYKSFDFISIEQHPEWLLLTKNSGRIAYFSAKLDGEIVCYTPIAERYNSEAKVIFGPISKSNTTLINSIEFIYNYYKRKKFAYLSIQLGMLAGFDAQYIQYNLYKKINFKTSYNKLNKSSLITELDRNIEEIERDFSTNHKRSIKKAIKEGLYTEILTNKSDIELFAKQYIGMYQHRELSVAPNEVLSSFNLIFDFIEKNKNGFFLGVKNNVHELIGGVLIIYQGNTSYYYRGYSSPSNRVLPITHLAFFEAMKLSKTDGIINFDYGGYNHLVDEKDQIFQINHFKSGFSKNYIFYPMLMHFKVSYFSYFVYLGLRKLKNLSKKLLSSD